MKKKTVNQEAQNQTEQVPESKANGKSKVKKEPKLFNVFAKAKARHVMTSMLDMDLPRQQRWLNKFLPGHWHGKKTQVANRYVPRRDGSRLRLMIAWSKNGTTSDAVGLLWLHGGAYTIGMPEQEFAMADHFCSADDCVMIIPEYRLADTAPYPAALQDAYLALAWMKENARTLGIDDSKLFVGGECAGGGLAVALSLYARDRHEIAIAYQMPLFPMMDDRTFQHITPRSTWEKNLQKGWEAYLATFNNPYRVPDYAAPGRANDLKQLPPACIYVGEDSLLLDESEAYAESLKDNDIDVAFKTFPGKFHVFDWLTLPNKTLRAARSWALEQFTEAKEKYSAKQPRRNRRQQEMIKRRWQLRRRRNQFLKNQELSKSKES